MANQLKIQFAGEVVRRFKETTKTGKEMCYIAVKVPRGEWSDVFRLKVKDAETVKPFAVGAKVVCEAFVGGREWTNQETKKTSYFVDLNLFKIENEKPSEDGKNNEESVKLYDEVSDEMPF